MSENEKTGQILHLTFPDECEAVGPTVVDGLLIGRSITEPDEGRRMDLGGVIQALTDAITFITAVLGLWAQLKATRSAKPTKTELQAEVAENRPPVGSLDTQQQEQIIEAVVQQDD